MNEERSRWVEVLSEHHDDFYITFVYFYFLCCADLFHILFQSYSFKRGRDVLDSNDSIRCYDSEGVFTYLFLCFPVLIPLQVSKQDVLQVTANIFQLVAFIKFSST